MIRIRFAVRQLEEMLDGGNSEYDPGLDRGSSKTNSDHRKM